MSYKRELCLCMFTNITQIFVSTLFFKIKYCRKLNMYIEVSCFILFLIHISIIGYYQLYPTETSTRLSERKLDDLDFPVLFKICLNPAFNEDNIKEVGYYSLWSYFTGKGRWRNRNGAAVYGWAGHWENGSIVSSIKGELINLS